MDRSRGMSRFQRHVPWFQMFDDHELHDNLFGAGQVGFKKKGSRHINRDTQLRAWNITKLVRNALPTDLPHATDPQAYAAAGALALPRHRLGAA